MIGLFEGFDTLCAPAQPARGAGACAGRRAAGRRAARRAVRAGAAARAGALGRAAAAGYGGRPGGPPCRPGRAGRGAAAARARVATAAAGAGGAARAAGRRAAGRRLLGGAVESRAALLWLAVLYPVALWRAGAWQPCGARAWPVQLRLGGAPAPLAGAQWAGCTAVPACGESIWRAPSLCWPRRGKQRVTPFRLPAGQHHARRAPQLRGHHVCERAPVRMHQHGRAAAHGGRA